MKYIFLFSLSGCSGYIYSEHKERLRRLQNSMSENTIQVGTKGKPCARYLIDDIWVEIYDCGPNNEYSNYKD